MLGYAPHISLQYGTEQGIMGKTLIQVSTEHLWVSGIVLGTKYLQGQEKYNGLSPKDIKTEPLAGAPGSLPSAFP